MRCIGNSLTAQRANRLVEILFGAHEEIVDGRLIAGAFAVGPRNRVFIRGLCVAEALHCHVGTGQSHGDVFGLGMFWEVAQ